MKTEHLISVDEFCTHHNIETSFIRSLQQTGLVEIITLEESGFIYTNQLPEVEKYIRFYYDLDINLEGIETITHMLQRINLMHDEIVLLHNKLLLYEADL